MPLQSFMSKKQLTRLEFEKACASVGGKAFFFHCGCEASPSGFPPSSGSSSFAVLVPLNSSFSVGCLKCGTCIEKVENRAGMLIVGQAHKLSTVVKRWNSGTY